MTRTNEDRAAEGVELCNRMNELIGSETLPEQITDIIAQLMHTCQTIPDEEGNPIDFEECLRMARMHFEAEIAEDQE